MDLLISSILNSNNNNNNNTTFILEKASFHILSEKENVNILIRNQDGQIMNIILLEDIFWRDICKFSVHINIHNINWK